MKKTVFKIHEMDCPSEEQMIRMKLSESPDLINLEFDIPNRIMVAFHYGDHEKISRLIREINFSFSIIETEEVLDTSKIKSEAIERSLLYKVLIINFLFFVLEVWAGFLGDSMGLIADGIDMLADSFVYGLAIYAIGGSSKRKKNIAMLAGYFQLLLALLGFIEVIKRFLDPIIFPQYNIMISISILALAGNLLSLYILQKSRSNEAHMKASMIFTSNDVIVNFGVILAGIFVYVTNSRYPDLIIGLIVFMLVVNGGLKIVKLSK